MYPSEVDEIHSAEDVVNFMADIYKRADWEMIYALCLDTKGKIMSIESVTVGTLNANLYHKPSLEEQRDGSHIQMAIIIKSKPPVEEFLR